jgi:hypothetical protein
MGPVTVGSPEQVADFMEEWIDDTGMDGFNMAYVTTPGTFADFIDLVIPVLQERDLFKTDYSEGTYREKLFKKSHFLPDEHYGAQYRKTSQKESLT